MKEHQVRTMHETQPEAALLPAKSTPQSNSAAVQFEPRQSTNVKSEQGRATATSTWPEHSTLPGVTTSTAGPQNGPVSKANMHADHIRDLFPNVK
jgi:hypothetical protein